MVFCNKIEACRAVENHLRRKHGKDMGQRPVQVSAAAGPGPAVRITNCKHAAVCVKASCRFEQTNATQPNTQVYAYHEAINEADRSAALNSFLAPVPPPDHNYPAASVVLVCTDRTSRGIDSVYCEHVVLFDMPRDPSEYVRRAGRTARGAGGRGVVSILVLGKQVGAGGGLLLWGRCCFSACLPGALHS